MLFSYSEPREERPIPPSAPDDAREPSTPDSPDRLDEESAEGAVEPSASVPDRDDADHDDGEHDLEHPFAAMNGDFGEVIGNSVPPSRNPHLVLPLIDSGASAAQRTVSLIADATTNLAAFSLPSPTMLGVASDPAQLPLEYVPIAMPIAPKEPTILADQGPVRVDNYYWMRDRSDPRVMAYLQAENEFAHRSNRHLEPLRQQLFQEFLLRGDEEDISIQFRKESTTYYTRSVLGRQYELYCRWIEGGEEEEGREEVLLDLNDVARGAEVCKLGAYEISPDERYLAYSVDRSGSERYEVYVKNLETGELVGAPIHGAAGTLEWLQDSSGFCYCVLDSAMRWSGVKLHTLGDPAASDRLLFHESDRRYEVALSKSDDKKLFFITSTSYSGTEVWFAPTEGALRFARVCPRSDGHVYEVSSRGDEFIIRTNLDAPNFRLVSAPRGESSPNEWREIVAHDPSTRIESIEQFKDFIVRSERQNGLRRLAVQSMMRDGAMTGDEVRYIEFPDEIYATYLSAYQRNDSNVLRLHYSTPFRPNRIFDVDLSTGEWALIDEQKTPAGFDPAQYLIERRAVPTDGGRAVPMYLMYKKDGKPLSERPLVLEAYAAYDVVLYEPDYVQERLSLMDRGVICAVAHPRGGGELDRAWYLDGKFESKPNSIADFIRCVEYARDHGLCHPDKVASMGVSAGGLLVSASMNARPELFRVVVAEVPFLDALTTMFDPGIPLTNTEFEEWGNPVERRFYDAISGYSPYDNIRRGAYPPLLVTAGLNDARVQFWEPAKFVAKLRDCKTDENPLYLVTNMGAGHSGASGRYDEYRETAFKYAFLLENLA